MAMLTDMLKNVFVDQKGQSPNIDNYMLKPPSILENDGKAVGRNWDLRALLGMTKDEPNIIMGDDGSYTSDQRNPFLDAIRKSKGGQGTIMGFLKQIMPSGLVVGTGTVGGSDPSVVPGMGQDAALDPTPMAKQKQRGLAPSAKQLTEVAPPKKDYSMPTALDPQSIEELRTSLLTQAGQMDPTNPNGLSGRMNSPLANSDMGQQRNEAMRIEDSIRGFDGGKKPRKMAGDFNGDVNSLSEADRNFTGARVYQGDPQKFMKEHTGPDEEGYDGGPAGNVRRMYTRQRKPPVATS